MTSSKPVFSTIFIFATIASTLFFEHQLWGLSAWGSVSPIASLVLGLAILIVFWKDKAIDPFVHTRAIGSRLLRSTMVAILCISALHMLHARHELWGDRVNLISALEHGHMLPEEPLGTMVHFATYRFVNSIFLLNARETVILLAIAAGTAFVFVCMKAAATLFPAEEEKVLRRVSTAALISNGFAVAFLEGGNSSLSVLLCAAFLATALESVRGKGSILVATILFSAAFLSNVWALGMLPAFAYLVWRKVNSGSRREVAAAIALIPGIWIIMEGASLVLYQSSATRAMWSNAVTAWKLTRKEPLVLAEHLPHSLNALLLIGPASIAAIILLFAPGRALQDSKVHAEDSRIGRLLLLSILGGIATSIAASRAIEKGLRWDTIASAGPAFSIYAIRGIRLRAPSIEKARKFLLALFLLGIFHTFSLVLLATMPGLAGQRILALPLGPGTGEMILAEHEETRGNKEAARKWYEASLEKNPANPTAERRLGYLAMKEEEYTTAITHFLNAHELDRNNPRFRLELAEALIAQRWFPEAIAQLETLTTAYPESVLFWSRLGFALNHSFQFDDAIAAYEKALELEPENETNTTNLVSALLNRGAKYQREGKTKEARSLYERAIALYPNDWHANNNLAIMEFDAGNLDKAEEILRQTLEQFPYVATLHVNLGLVLEKKGRLTEALVYFQRGLELDPIGSEAGLHIERIEEKLGLHEENQEMDQGDSQRRPLNNP